MLPDRVSNRGPLTYESGALPIAPRGPAAHVQEKQMFYFQFYPVIQIRRGKRDHLGIIFDITPLKCM